MIGIHKNVRHYKALNNFLDHFSHLHIKIFGQKYPTYKVCGISGYILALILGALLVIYLDLSFGIAFLLLFTTFATFVFMAMIIKIISHKERLIFYHHLITVFLTTALVLWLLKQPVFAYLDIIALGFGTFLVCCRIGCLMVGCCHGKPHSWGICYGQKHVDKGFTDIFQGIRLFPVQALELLWVFLITIVGIFLIVFKAPAGETFLWYIMTYCMGRFFIEFLRGDFGRTYFYGFSEAQWISISLMFIALGIEWQIRADFHIWHIIICIF
ncbi:MAG: prolipoprotein diacylglyceryl transferase, partial [Desulfobacteraceae bacterium]|nr:prolipoprotein diacylglyceryl transferase [Desulfobacteraceae bacterium]